MGARRNFCLGWGHSQKRPPHAEKVAKRPQHGENAAKRPQIKLLNPNLCGRTISSMFTEPTINQ